MSLVVVVVWQLGAGLTEALLGAASAATAVFAHAQLLAQVFHGVRAGMYRITDILFCNSTANADVHKNNPVNINESYSRSHHWACQSLLPMWDCK
jgi:hypothetical protein